MSILCFVYITALSFMLVIVDDGVEKSFIAALGFRIRRD